MSTSAPESVEIPSVQGMDPHTSIVGGVDAEAFTAPQDGVRRNASAVGTGVLKKSPDLKNVSFGGITSEDGRKAAPGHPVPPGL